jgi:hypothetical protein
MSRLFTNAFFAFLMLMPIATIAQDEEKKEPVTVHVKEVNRTDGDYSEKGAWFNITAVLESKTIIYSVKCQEFYRYDDKAYTIRCFPISAGKDYSGLKFASSILLWPPAAKHYAYRLGTYTIVSEKEK